MSEKTFQDLLIEFQCAVKVADRPHATKYDREVAMETGAAVTETYRALSEEVAALREALRSLARIETDEEGLPVLVISCGWHCQTSDQTELPLVWAALSRPALTGNGGKP